MDFLTEHYKRKIVTQAVKLEVQAPELLNLSLVDLPGIEHTDKEEEVRAAEENQIRTNISAKWQIRCQWLWCCQLKLLWSMGHF